MRPYGGFEVTVCWVPAPGSGRGQAFRAGRCWWVVETGVWVPAFAGMTEGREGRLVAGDVGLVGCGDGGLGPRFRGDDGGGGRDGRGFTSWAVRGNCRWLAGRYLKALKCFQGLPVIRLWRGVAGDGGRFRVWWLLSPWGWGHGDDHVGELLVDASGPLPVGGVGNVDDQGGA